MTAPDEIDCLYANHPVCPYCGHKHADAWEWDDDGETECGECERTFRFVRNISVTYSTRTMESPA